MSIDQAFSSLANHGARWIFWLLVALSVLALAIAVDRIVLLVASRDDAGRLRSDLLEALRRTGGNQTRAAELLHMTVRSLRHCLDKYGIRQMTSQLREIAANQRR